MTGNVLLTIRKIIQDGTRCFLIGSHRVSAQSGQDYTVITNGLALWVTILLDQCTRFSSTDAGATCRGRIVKIRLPRVLEEEGVIDLNLLLSYLDGCDEALIGTLATSDHFKDDRVRKYIQNETTVGLEWCRSCLLQLLAVLRTAYHNGEVSEAGYAQELHQTFCFLKKLQIERPDLKDTLFSEYLLFENHIRENVLPSLQLEAALQDIFDMNTLARTVLADFRMSVIAPRHGPGAVSDSRVKDWFTKNLSMSSDARIGYLLRSRDLGLQSDYCPWVRNDTSKRQSRFVGVPKTWKKLRGIAAEPVELQFYQQGVFRALDQFFRESSWWRSRVDLHDQDTSQELARLGSIHDGYATIDLSSASDSVTLELVKKVFKGTPILPWLLGTRSTSCRVGDDSVTLLKFASMGSACCFPTECMIFTLAAQVASDRTRGFLSRKTEKIRVFGDDIIVEWYAAEETIAILQRLGFSVNTEKSYLSGRFREACGAECYSGVDIRPIRYKALRSLPADRLLDGATSSTCRALVNSLYARGYRIASRSLLELLLQSKVKVGKQLVTYGGVIPFSFSGERGTIASSTPTNFNVNCRWDRNLFLLKRREVIWKMKPTSRAAISQKSEMFVHMQYVAWQIGHQAGLRDWDLAWEDGYLLDFDVAGWDGNPTGNIVLGWSRLPLGVTMAPTCKWVCWDSADTLAGSLVVARR